MASAAAAAASALSLLKPITMADKTSCVLNSIQTPLFTSSSSSKTLKNTKFLEISSTAFTSKPCNLKWVCAKNRNLSVLVPFVAQTSDWAQPQQGEEEVEEEDTVAETVVEDGDDENGAGEMLFSENLEDAKIFVGNLPYDVDSEALAQLFNQAGVVEIAEVIYNRETDQSRGFGFVTMSTVEKAEKAVEKFSQHEINGRFLTVNKATGPRGSPRPERTPRAFAASNRLYVGNLAWQVDDSRLEQVFSEHGKVVDARVVYDRETQRSRGFGFVTMSNETEVNDAIAALDGQSLDGRAIKVNVAEERPRRNSF